MSRLELALLSDTVTVVARVAVAAFPVVSWFRVPTLRTPSLALSPVPANLSASLLTFVIRMVPPSLCRKPSPEATAVVPLAVPPSMRLISAAVAVIDVPAICKVVALTSPDEPYITAFEFTIVPADEPSTKFNSEAVDSTPSSMLISLTVAEIPSRVSSSVTVTPAACRSFRKVNAAAVMSWSGRVIVLSPVGSATVKVVSFVLAVEPSNTIEESDKASPDTVGLVSVLFVRVCDESS